MLKHIKDQVDKINSVFVNMIQILNFISLEKTDVTAMYMTIKKWLQQNELNILNIKVDFKKKAFVSLVTLLYNAYNDLFMNQSSIFIKAVMMFMIQQKLLNMYCSADKIKAIKDSALLITSQMSERVKLKENLVSSSLTSMLVSVNIKDFEIQAYVIQESVVKLSSHLLQLSAVTVKNVTSETAVSDKSVLS